MFSIRIYTPLMLLALASPAMADMVYKPFNPSFGGDSFNASHLQSMATAQNQHKEHTSSSRESNSDRFIDMLESRLYSSLASQVSEAIFGENAQESGVITFDDQTISFVRDTSEIRLTVTDRSGQITNIVIPVLQ